MMLEPNQDVFDENLGLTNAAEDEELYIDILRIFLQDVKEQEKQMAKYLEEGALKDYEVIVHGVKNNLRTAGASKAGQMALDLEMHCKSGDLDYVRAAHSEFVEMLALAKKYMRQYLWDKE